MQLSMILREFKWIKKKLHKRHVSLVYTSEDDPWTMNFVLIWNAWSTIFEYQVSSHEKTTVHANSKCFEISVVQNTYRNFVRIVLTWVLKHIGRRPKFPKRAKFREGKGFTIRAKSIWLVHVELVSRVWELRDFQFRATIILNGKKLEFLGSKSKKWTRLL